MSRRTLTDAPQQRTEARVPGNAGDRGATGRDNRLFVDAVLWLVRTGAPWRDLPPEFGSWSTVWRRFDRWAKAGVWQRLFAALAEDPDFEHGHIPHRFRRTRGMDTRIPRRLRRESFIGCINARKPKHD